MTDINATDNDTAGAVGQAGKAAGHTAGSVVVATDTYGRVCVKADNGDRIAVVCEYAPRSDTPDAHFANARRLVACWNACEGVPTEAMERGEFPMNAARKVAETLADRDRLREVNAELRAALEAIAAPIDGVPVGDPWEFYKDLQRISSAALEKAKA